MGMDARGFNALTAAASALASGIAPEDEFVQTLAKFGFGLAEANEERRAAVQNLERTQALEDERRVQQKLFIDMLGKVLGKETGDDASLKVGADGKITFSGTPAKTEREIQTQRERLPLTVDADILGPSADYPVSSHRTPVDRAESVPAPFRHSLLM
jgi:hypothetical protein